MEEIEQLVESKQRDFKEIADEIWEFAETGFEEHESAKVLIKTLEDAGFVVEEGGGGVETAFTATFDKGGEVVGIPGEYDVWIESEKKRI